jgi:oligopeptide transport system substrate-binding protein
MVYRLLGAGPLESSPSKPSTKPDDSTGNGLMKLTTLKYGFKIVLMACILALLSGCGPKFSERKTADGRILHLCLASNPTTLDPATVQDVETLSILKNAFEGLVSFDSHNRLVGQLAESWDVQNGGRTYLFHLRKGVKFQNGRLLTAQDLKYSIDRACSPQIASPTSGNYLGDIVGARERMSGIAKDVSGVVAIDERTLKISIDQPRAYFLAKLTYPCSFAVAKEAAGEDQILRPEQAVGTGPFQIKALVPEQQISLTSFGDYYEGRAKLDGIEAQVIKDASTRRAKYANGEIQIARVDRQDVMTTKADPILGPQLRLMDRPSVAYLALNPGGFPPLANVHLRRAIAMGIDRRKLVEEVLGGVNPLADGILPPGVIPSRPSACLPFDPGRAVSELKASGLHDLPPIEIVYRDQNPDARIVCEAIASQLQKNLGLKVSLRTMEWGSMLKRRNQGLLPCFVMQWVGDYLDPQNFLSNLLTTHGGGNHFGYSNPMVDRLCDQADAAGDPNLRAKLYVKAERQALQDAPWVPLYFGRDFQLVSPRVIGLEDNLLGSIGYRTVDLKP